jgi:hypothetical protein
MSSWLSGLSGDQLLGFFGILGGCGILAVAIIAGYSLKSNANEHKAHLAESELALKADMIKRGMSAEEIERVLQASAGGKCK